MHSRLSGRIMRTGALGLIIAVLLSALIGCSVLSGAVGRAVGNSMAASSESSSTSSADTSTEGTNGGSRVAASPMEGAMQQAQFSLVYSQVFYVGGFGLENARAKVGRLLEWRIDATGAKGTDTLYADRALLAEESDGTQWWYLAYRAKDANLEYAVQMDGEMNPLLLRYRSENTGRIEEVKYDRSEASQKGGEGRSGYVMNDPDAYAHYQKGQETITVGAGTFRTDKLVDTYTDPNDSTRTVVYTWWVSRELPGLVKYDWTNARENSSMKGELVKVQDGFTTPLMP